MESGFADFCRSLRKRKRLSQKQLAEKAALCLRTVVYWENGEREPRADELQRVLQVLDATEAEIEQAYLLQTTQRGITMARSRLHDTPRANGQDGLLPDLGDLLTAIRMRQGWSQDHLARQMGVNRSTIVRWERTEQLPTEENLVRLFAILNVYPPERFALLTRRMLPPLWQQQTSIDSCMYRIERFCHSVEQLETPLIDLNALTLKRELFLTARSDPRFAVLIARIETYLGKWLLAQDRISEATRCVERAINLAAAQQDECDFWHATLNLAACCVGTKKPDGATKSLRLLRRWQSGVSDPDVRFLLYCDMAYYAAQAGHNAMALELLCAAKGMMPSIRSGENRLMYYNTTYARVLHRAGRPYEALDVLPTATMPGYQDLLNCYVRANLFLDAGERDEARRCIDAIYAKLENHGSRLIRQLTDTIAQRL